MHVSDHKLHSYDVDEVKITTFELKDDTSVYKKILNQAKPLSAKYVESFNTLFPFSGTKQPLFNSFIHIMQIQYTMLKL